MTTRPIQMQVFFTIGIAVPLTNERVRAFQVVALLVATAGIAVIAAHSDLATTPAGLVLVLLAALCSGGREPAREEQPGAQHARLCCLGQPLRRAMSRAPLKFSGRRCSP